MTHVGDRTMLKRFVIMLSLGFALLFSQGGVLLIAALCPHLTVAARVCETPEVAQAEDHSQMDHHGMDHETPVTPPAPGPTNDGNVVGHQQQSCSHCVIHSRSNSNLESVRTANVVKRAADLDMSNIVIALPAVAPVRIAMLTPRVHGPPGALSSRPRHVLISTFRI